MHHECVTQSVSLHDPPSHLWKNRLEPHLFVPDGSTLTNQLGSTSSPGGPVLQAYPRQPPPPWGPQSNHSSKTNPPPPILRKRCPGKKEVEKKIKQRGWQHINHLASIWMTSMLMQRRPGEKQWQKLDFVSVCVYVCVFTCSVRADLPCTEEPSVSSCFSFPVWRWARGRKMRRRTRREGGWTMGKLIQGEQTAQPGAGMHLRRWRIHVLHYTLVGEKRRCRKEDGEKTTQFVQASSIAEVTDECHCCWAVWMESQMHDLNQKCTKMMETVRCC